MKAEDNRSRNLLVFGITEEDDESLQTKVSELLEQLDERLWTVKELESVQPALHQHDLSSSE